ncbi:MAG: hypothetical protein ACOYBQ_09860 [Fluviibacter sp.]
MTVHLVYPCANLIKTPEVIGYNVYCALTSAGFDVVVHRWDSLSKIYPREGDILIGHAHPNPFTIFRRSLSESGWAKRILMLPFSHDPKQLGFLRDVVPQCDAFLAITGKYWIDTLNQSIFAGWSPRMHHLDLAVNREHFPRIKERFNVAGERKFLYIGHSRFFKNTPYLQELAQQFGPERFATIGCVLDGLISYGKLNFAEASSLEIIKQYDFLVMTSVSDPNPTTVLEAMGWGLVPVVTPQCGYYNEPGIVNIPLGDTDGALEKLNWLDTCSEESLRYLVRQNDLRLEEHFNWERFCDQVLSVCEERTELKPLAVTSPAYDKMREGEYCSPNYPWRIFNLAMLFKPYLPRFIVKWLALKLQ